MDVLFNKTINVLSGMLDYRTKRHKVIVSNVTNMDTPDFKPSDVTFKNELGKTGKLTMTTTAPGHILPGKGSAGPVQYEIKTSEESGKIDTEMANLAENHLMYNTTVEMLARKFRGLNTVLKETR
ncbi:MAG: flagellar basal body rod protein FlgB [Deltaproteobacteria bacterium]|nr:flagellar basal body rod protein FlgB [Deltaproteobacteria bacterium]